MSPIRVEISFDDRISLGELSSLLRNLHDYQWNSTVEQLVGGLVVTIPLVDDDDGVEAQPSDLEPELVEPETDHQADVVEPVAEPAPAQPAPPSAAAADSVGFPCPECGNTFRSQQGLSGHMRGHRKRPIACDRCGRICNDGTGLASHRRHCTATTPASSDGDWASRVRDEAHRLEERTASIRTTPTPAPAPPAAPSKAAAIRTATAPKLAPVDRPAADNSDPWECSCGWTFPTRAGMAEHRQLVKGAARPGDHRIIRQPDTTPVPAGIPAHVDELAARRSAGAYMDEQA